MFTYPISPKKIETEDEHNQLNMDPRVDISSTTSKITILIHDDDGHLAAVREHRRMKQINDSYSKILRQFVSEDEVSNWSVQVDWENGGAKFVEENGKFCTSVSELMLHNNSKTKTKKKRKLAEAEDGCDMGIDQESLELINALTTENEVIGTGSHNWVRRSVRASGQTAVLTRQVKELTMLLESNLKDAVVLKLKHYLSPDANSIVIDCVLRSLLRNNNCQALYIQNFNEGMMDPQLSFLSKVLRKGNIWCLNIGENYKISPSAWTRFAKSLKHTNVTHMYASEHVISIEQKTLFRNIIRENRKKHNKHNTIDNLSVIERCTNMWWNPIHSAKLVTALRNRATASTSVSLTNQT